MKSALFLGCTIPARSRNYEMSARRVAERLDIRFVDIKEFICCGFPMKSIDRWSAQVMAAYNLCLAQEQHLDLCALCSSCASVLKEAAEQLSEAGPEREKVNKQLSKLGLRYEGHVKVSHFARSLYEDITPPKIRETIEKDLSGLKIAIHYGCHYLREPFVYDHLDNLKSLADLISITGAQVVHYAGEDKCCGGPVLPVDETSALSVAKEKLEAVTEAGADALCVVCPFCSVMYDSNQKGINSAFDAHFQVPVLYLTQLLGLAFGYDSKALGLNMNAVKTKRLLSKIDA